MRLSDDDADAVWRSQAGPVFPASYRGTCFGCGGPIDEGDSVCYDEGDMLVHEECVDV